MTSLRNGLLQALRAQEHGIPALRLEDCVSLPNPGCIHGADPFDPLSARGCFAGANSSITLLAMVLSIGHAIAAATDLADDQLAKTMFLDAFKAADHPLLDAVAGSKWLSL